MRRFVKDLSLVECSAGELSLRSLDLRKRSIEFVASTEALDSHGTVVVQDWDLSRYLKNPVVLLEHGRAVGGFFSGSGERDIDKLPIARSENIRVEGDALRMRVVFPDEGRDERSDAVWRAIEDGRLNAVSVGFLPGEMTEEEMPDGDRKNVDGSPKTKTVTRISKNTLYELSVVGLPSNPEAVAIRALSVRNAAARSLTKTMQMKSDPKADDALDAAMRHLDRELVDAFFARADVKEVLASLRGTVIGAPPKADEEPALTAAEQAEDGELEDARAVVPYGAHPPVEGAWDGDGAKVRVAKWASSDGSGDEDKISWPKYGSAFTWYDAEKPDQKGSYKLPHHDVQGGKLVTVKAGVVAAGNAIQGARGGVSIPAGDVAGVRRHLAGHYRQFDMTPPWENQKELAMDPELFKKCIELMGCAPDTSPESLVECVDMLVKHNADLVEEAMQLGRVIDLLGLPPEADEAAIMRALAALSTLKTDPAIETRLLELGESLARALDREADREVAFIVDAGEKGIYGLGKGQNRKALKALRQIDPKGFAEDYKAALDGLRAFDDPSLFAVKTVTVASASPTDLAPPAASEGDAEDKVRDFDSRVDAYVAREKAEGRDVSRALAYDLVARGRDLAAR